MDAPADPTLTTRLARRLAARFDGDTATMAWVLAQHRARGVGEAEIAARLGIAPDLVPRLALCNRPRPDLFVDDVAAIAARFGLQVDRLAELVRAVEPPLPFTRLAPDSAGAEVWLRHVAEERGGYDAGAAESWEGVRAVIGAAGDGVEIAVATQVIGGGVTWLHAAERPYPAASTIKAAILVALYREVEAGRVALDAEVAVTEEARVQGSGVLTWMRDGLRLAVADLAYLMIAISDNTASNVLIDLIGRERIAATLETLGLRVTRLNRRFLGRLPGPDEPENWTSAADLAALFAAIATDRAASPSSCAAMREIFGLQQHRDRLARHLPPAWSYAGKTGTLPALAHDAGLITTPRGTLAIAVLTRGFADPYAADATIGAIARAAVVAAGLAAPD